MTRIMQAITVPQYRAGLPLAQLKQLLMQPNWTQLYFDLKLKTRTLPEEGKPPVLYSGKDRTTPLEEVLNGKSPTVTQFLTHVINKAIQYHAPPIVIGRILMDAQWCSVDFQKKWNRYKIDKSNKVFQQPLRADDLVATWM